MEIEIVVEKGEVIKTKGCILHSTSCELDYKVNKEKTYTIDADTINFILEKYDGIAYWYSKDTLYIREYKQRTVKDFKEKLISMLKAYEEIQNCMPTFCIHIVY